MNLVKINVDYKNIVVVRPTMLDGHNGGRSRTGTSRKWDIGSGTNLSGIMWEQPLWWLRWEGSSMWRERCSDAPMGRCEMLIIVDIRRGSGRPKKLRGGDWTWHDTLAT